MNQLNEYRIPLELLQACINTLNRLEAGAPVPGTPFSVRILLNRLEQVTQNQDAEFAQEKERQQRADQEDLAKLRQAASTPDQ